MSKRAIVFMCAATLSGALLTARAADAQTPVPSPRPPAETAPTTKAPAETGLPINIRIEVSISDQSGTNAPAKKVVTMIASDRNSVNVRSSASVPVRMSPPGPPGPAGATTPVQTYTYKTVQINVDARPSIIQKEPNKIALNFGLEYLPTSRLTAQEEGEPGLTSWNERLSVILESGKPMVVSQAADPTSDRKITVEVTATILK